MTYPQGIKQKPSATRAYYGDLSDGNVTVSTNTTLTRDMYYDVLTVDVGIVLSSANFRIFADTIVNNGTIDCSGGNASGQTGGVAVANGSMVGGTNGGAGITQTISHGTAANPGTSVLTSQEGKGGRGGTGGAATGSTGGVGGLLNPGSFTSGDVGTISNAPQLMMNVGVGTNTVPIGGGTGGGGGGADAVGDKSGAGGAGGGCIAAACRSLQGSGVFSANGGNGSNAVTGASGAGGGAGGGAGTVRVMAGDTSQWTGSISVAAGAAGTGLGNGSTGNAGGTGTVNLIHA